MEEYLKLFYKNKTMENLEQYTLRNKNNSTLHIIKVEDKGRLKDINGWIEFSKLEYLLRNNGYQYIS